MRAETRRQSVALFDLSCAHSATHIFADLYMFSNDHESTMSNDVRVTSNL